MPYQATAIRPRMMAGMFAPSTPNTDSADHRIGHARSLAGLGDQVAEEVDDGDADQQRHQHLPAGQAEREQAARGHVAADAVHVGHPEREDVVGGPGLLAQRGEVLVGQPRVVARFDDAAADRMAGRFDEITGADNGARRKILRSLRCVDVRHARTLSTAYFAAFPCELPGYCALLLFPTPEMSRGPRRQFQCGDRHSEQCCGGE